MKPTSLIPCCLFLLALGGCASAITEPKFDDPTASLTDTVVYGGKMSDKMFYLLQIDGQDVPNSAIASTRANYDKGPSLSTTVLVERSVPARKCRLKLAGSTIYGAEIVALFRRNDFVAGVVEFSPEAGRPYAIKGTLSPEYSAVWIEEVGTGRIVTEKIERRK